MRDCITRVTQLLAGGAEGAVQRAMRASFLISAGGGCLRRPAVAHVTRTA